MPPTATAPTILGARLLALALALADMAAHAFCRGVGVSLQPATAGQLINLCCSKVRVLEELLALRNISVFESEPPLALAHAHQGHGPETPEPLLARQMPDAWRFMLRDRQASPAYDEATSLVLRPSRRPVDHEVVRALLLSPVLSMLLLLHLRDSSKDPLVFLSRSRQDTVGGYPCTVGGNRGGVAFSHVSALRGQTRQSHSLNRFGRLGVL